VTPWPAAHATRLPTVATAAASPTSHSPNARATSPLPSLPPADVTYTRKPSKPLSGLKNDSSYVCCGT